MPIINADDTTMDKAPVVTGAASSNPFADDYLERKFARGRKEPQAVVYEISRDPGYLHQYYRLREQMFITVWGLSKFSGKQDAYDDASEIIIARIGNHVVGGCRLTFSSPDDHMALPMEKDEIDLIKTLPDLPLKDIMYAEISRLAILPEYQNSFVMLELIRQMIKLGASRKARYAVTLSPLPLARNYRKATTLFGLKWDIRNDIEIPDREEYEGIKMVLSVLDLTSIYRRKPQTVSHTNESVVLTVP